MRDIVAAILLGILLPNLASTETSSQPSYITNIYFCDNAQRREGFIQPDRVFNKLKAGDANLSAEVVLNLIVDKGRHKLEIEIFDKNGSLIDKLKFEPVKADSDNWTYTATGRFGGALPEGGVLFKVFDHFNSEAKFLLGTFRMMTTNW